MSCFLTLRTVTAWSLLLMTAPLSLKSVVTPLAIYIFWYVYQQLLYNNWACSNNCSYLVSEHFNETHERVSVWLKSPFDNDFSLMVRVKWSEPDGWTQLCSPSYDHWLRSHLGSRWGAGTRVSSLTEIPLAPLKYTKKTQKKRNALKAHQDYIVLLKE